MRSHRMRARVLPAICAGIVALMFAGMAHAQDSVSPKAPARSASFCLRLEAEDRCQLLLISEAGMYGRLVRPTRLRVIPRSPGQSPDSIRLRQPAGLLVFELGALASVSARSSLGATFVLAAGSDILAQRAITGVKGRYRHRLTAKGLALDVGAGVESRPEPWYSAASHTTGLTADIALNHRDVISAVVRYDGLRLDGKIKPEVSLGARLNGRAGGFAGGGTLLTVATLYLLFVVGYQEGT